MLVPFKGFFTRNIGLKILSLMLALVSWFYIANELQKGSEEDRLFLKKVLPSEGVVAKKLVIKPIFVGKPRWGYVVIPEKTVVVPDSCVAVGTKGLLAALNFAYTVPIDVSGATKNFSISAPLESISPGVYMGETSVNVTVTIERVSG